MMILQGQEYELEYKQYYHWVCQTCHRTFNWIENHHVEHYQFLAMFVPDFLANICTSLVYFAVFSLEITVRRKDKRMNIRSQRTPNRYNLNSLHIKR